MARPRREIDLEQVEDMASEFCTQEEIARDMGFERTMFHRRKELGEAFERGKNTAKMSLRHMMWNAARSGDRVMMLFLAKNELGYRDNPEPKEADDKVVENSNKQMVSLANLINKPVPERKLEDMEATMEDTTEGADAGGDAE